MKKLQRDSKIKLHLVGDKKWEIRNTNKGLMVDGDADYLIYMKNVNFKKGNIIEGRFLGEIEADSPLLTVADGSLITIDDGKFKANGEDLRTAKMVVVNNKTNVIVVISNGR